MRGDHKANKSCLKHKTKNGKILYCHNEVYLFCCFLNDELELDSNGGGGTAGGLVFRVGATSGGGIIIFWAGGCGGGPRLVRKFSSVAFALPLPFEFFCRLSVKCFVSSALKSRTGGAPVGPLELLLVTAWLLLSDGGDRFIVPENSDII